MPNTCWLQNAGGVLLQRIHSIVEALSGVVAEEEWQVMGRRGREYALQT